MPIRLLDRSALILDIFAQRARTGEGIDEWADWLKEQVKAWQA